MQAMQDADEGTIVALLTSVMFIFLMTLGVTTNRNGYLHFVFIV